MSHRNTRIVAAAVLAGLAITGCSKGSPTGPTSASLAAHLDSLYVAAIAANTPGNTNRAQILSIMELAVAFGNPPKNVTVTTASGTQTWKELGLAVVDTSSSPTTSEYLSVAYSDANVTNAIFAEVDASGASADTSAGLLAADTIEVTGTGTVAASVLSNGGACTIASGLTNPIFGEAAAFKCNLATMQFAVNETFPATTGVAASLESISYAPIAVTGPRLSH
jgi:hypothetical protein